MKIILIFGMLLGLIVAAKAGEAKALFVPGKVKMDWQTVFDSVMGGKSKGILEQGDEGLVFSGKVSLENNGGFASFRSKPEKVDLSAYDGLKVWVKGTGRTYYLAVRTEGLGRLAYWAPVETKAGEWVEVDVKFGEFVPTFFGKELKGPKLNPAKINSVGFMLYDKKAGDYRLEVKRIEAFKK